MLPRSPGSGSGQHRRRPVLLIALASFVFHLWLAAKLSGVQATLAIALGTTDDDSSLRSGGGAGGDDARDLEGAEWRRLAGVSALLGIGRLWSWCSAGISLVGLYGLFTDRLSFVRLYTLNAFVSLALDFLLLALILLLLTIGNPSSSSSHGLATTLCQALSSSPAASSSLSLSFGLPDLLGLSLEACEDRFEGVVASALGSLAVVEGLRTWGAVKTLAYHYGRSSGSRRRTDGSGDRYFYDSPVELEASPSSAAGASLGRSASGKKKRRDSYSASSGSRRERSVSGSKARSPRAATADDTTRIFLLPRPEDRASKGRSEVAADEDVPLLALTASSPVKTSFPPTAQAQPVASGSGSGAEGNKVLVYAPVMVSPEEARSLGARELVLHGPGRSYPPPHRSSSSGSWQPQPAHHRAPRSRSATITPATSSSGGSTATLVIDTAAAAALPGPGPGSLRGAVPSRQGSDDPATPVAVRFNSSTLVDEPDARAKLA
ncbi:uncharacterized protein JCM10292_000148 [Rhodotorula paludigena]|uniref:uncharacterized protein n=1 Tax=Rhodotorula paludigena TaxID=86838 RepID=UPI00316D1A0A